MPAASLTTQVWHSHQWRYGLYNTSFWSRTSALDGICVLLHNEHDYRVHSRVDTFVTLYVHYQTNYLRMRCGFQCKSAVMTLSCTLPKCRGTIEHDDDTLCVLAHLFPTCDTLSHERVSISSALEVVTGQ